MKTIGIIGGGQLGRMLALAAYPLGFRCYFLETTADCPAGQVGPVIEGDYGDVAALERLRAVSDVITYEFENVPVESIRRLERRNAPAGAGARCVPVYPASDALAASQDRLAEKRLFVELGIPTTAFRPVANRAELEAARSGGGIVLKTRRHGYDGKGQYVLNVQTPPQVIDAAWAEVGGRDLIAEDWVGFDSECAMIAARGIAGDEAYYPLTTTRHEAGILEQARSPSQNLSPCGAERARDFAQRILSRFHYVGVLALELFSCGGELIANEFAPRVHNSGHWTQDGAAISQFEMHIRAICGLPLVDPQARGYSATLNLVGRLPDLSKIAEYPWARIHLYGKSSRVGRKLGHININAESEAQLAARINELSPLLRNEYGNEGLTPQFR